MDLTADHNLIRRHNTALVLNTLRRQAPISRAELSAATGLNRSTISSIIKALLEDGLVVETTYQSDRIGRPGMQLELNPGGGFAIGLEIGVDFISVIAADFTAKTFWRHWESSDPDDGFLAIIQRAFDLTEMAFDAGREHGMNPLGIGIGLPGLVDCEKGILMFAPNLGWKEIPIKEPWEERFKLPVFVENEANAIALGEYYFGSANEAQTFLAINAGVGLGAGIMINGDIFRGSRGYAAEIGHVKLVPDGEPCNCGKRGCYETIIGPRAVVKRVKEELAQGAKSSILSEAGNDPEKINFEAVSDAAAAGDAVCLAALKEVGYNLGIVTANMVNVFNPELVILCGALSYAAEMLLPEVQKSVKENALELSQIGLEIIVSEFGPEAVVVGAVALVLDSIWREPAFA
ncbi:MAG: ROK family transcriptional regulator [Anaerolineales bacterium]|nr:ROK family transcriptional regulator [Anaerolineales bacterium]